MKNFRISNVGVDAGLIMICDEKYYDKWGNKIRYHKNKFGVVCSQKIKVKPGTYKVKWSIDNTWNDAISGEGTVKTDSGIIAISDPCYCIRDWDKWLKDTNMANDVSDDVVLIDKMGGDGEYEVKFELTKKEEAISKEKFEAYRVIQRSGVTNMVDIKTVNCLTLNFSLGTRSFIPFPPTQALPEYLSRTGSSLFCFW